MNDFLERFMETAAEIKIKQMVQVGVIIFLLNNLLCFGLGYMIGYFSSDIVNQNLYEQKLIMRDFNITRVCFVNASDVLRIGQYTDKAMNNLKTTGTIEQKIVCEVNRTNKDNIAQ